MQCGVFWGTLNKICLALNYITLCVDWGKKHDRIYRYEDGWITLRNQLDMSDDSQCILSTELGHSFTHFSTVNEQVFDKDCRIDELNHVFYI